jgi:hypothetical protein
LSFPSLSLRHCCICALIKGNFNGTFYFLFSKRLHNVAIRLQHFCSLQKVLLLKSSNKNNGDFKIFPFCLLLKACLKAFDSSSLIITAQGIAWVTGRKTSEQSMIGTTTLFEFGLGLSKGQFRFRNQIPFIIHQAVDHLPDRMFTMVFRR